MHCKDLFSALSNHLDPLASRSLSLLFILQELEELFTQIEQIKNSPDALSDFFSLRYPFPQSGICPDKLCFYCAILLQTSKVKDSSLNKSLSDMRIAILQFRSLLVEDPKALLAPFEISFHSHLTSFFFSLVPHLFESRTDENILLKLIEQRKALNSHLGEGVIEKLLQSFFPKGFSYLRSAIHEGLTRRGFLLFLEEKESLIEEIEWESPCLTISAL